MMKQTTFKIVMLAVLAFALLQTAAAAVTSSELAPQSVQVPLHKSQVLSVERRIKKVSVGNPQVADILILRSRQVYVVGKALGTTNVVLWNSRGQVIDAFDVEVTHDLPSLKAKLHELMPEEKVGVYSSQGSLVLAGQVSDAQKVDTAVRVARSFLGRNAGEGEANTRLVNLLQVGGSQQVMLEVQVAEVQRSLIKRLGIDFQAVGTDSNVTFGALQGGGLLDSGPIPGEGLPLPGGTSSFNPNALSITNGGLFASFLDGSTLFNAVVNANRQNNLARVLAEPTLTTLTGQKATFTAGGEFPIPVPGEDGSTTIEFKEFGIGLGFLPVVLDSGRISLDVDIRVSELSNDHAATIAVPNTNTTIVAPSIRSRSANSTVELTSGQTMGIAGLINEDVRGQVDRFPGLGDIPVLGALFRSEEFQKRQTELVILVTPRFAKPATRADYSLPTDNFVDPSSIDFYLFGRLAGTPEKEKDQADAQVAEDTAVIEPAAVDARFGHEL